MVGFADDVCHKYTGFVDTNRIRKEIDAGYKLKAMFEFGLKKENQHKTFVEIMDELHRRDVIRDERG